MSKPSGVRSWVVELPPGRRLLLSWTLAIAVAVVGTAVVVYLYVSKILPIAGPFALLAWLPTLFLLRATVMYRSNRVWTRRLGLWVDLMAEQVETERRLAPQQRLSQASDESLYRAGQALTAARVSLRHGRIGDAVEVTTRLSSLMSGWSPGAPLTRQAELAVRAAGKLAENRAL